MQQVVRLLLGEQSRVSPLSSLSPNLALALSGDQVAGLVEKRHLNLAHLFVRLDGIQWSQIQRDAAGEPRRIVLPATKTKTATTRVIPVSSGLRAALSMRRYGPDGGEFPPTAYVFGNEVGEQVKSYRLPWEDAVLRAHGHTPKRKRGKLVPEVRAALEAIDLDFRDLRREFASRLLESSADLQRRPDVPRAREHHPDEHLSQQHADALTGGDEEVGSRRIRTRFAHDERIGLRRARENGRRIGRNSLSLKVVRKGRLELPRYCYRQPLKLVRLPIPPLPRNRGLRTAGHCPASNVLLYWPAGGCAGLA